MSVLRDWRYWLVILITIVCSSAAWLPWSWSKPDHSLAIKVLHQEGLGASDAGTVLLLTANGVRVPEPTVSVVQLVNDGAGPILERDFETPVQLRVQDSSTIADSKLAERSADDLFATVTWESHVLTIKPHLLNPGDFLNLQVITSGDRPEFHPLGRIAGVKAISVLKEDTKPSTVRAVVIGIAGFLILFAQNVVEDAVIRNPGFITLDRLEARVVSGILLAVGGIFSFAVTSYLFEDRWLYIGGSILAALLVSAIMATIFESAVRHRTAGCDGNKQ